MPCRKVTAANKYKAIAQNQIGSLHFLEKITKNTRKSKETAIHQNQLSNSSETDMTEGVKAKYKDLIQNGLTLEKRLGMPADVGKVVCLLANGGLPYGTGQVITLDGGMHIRRL